MDHHDSNLYINWKDMKEQAKRLVYRLMLTKDVSGNYRNLPGYFIYELSVIAAKEIYFNDTPEVLELFIEYIKLELPNWNSN